MPIYAYKCETCGHSADVLQKISDPLLSECPACGASTFVKQVTAAGFQLKGSGWYVTDFRDGGGAKKPDVKPSGDVATTPPTAPAGVGDSATPAAAGQPAGPAAPSSAATASPAPSAGAAPA